MRVGHRRALMRFGLGGGCRGLRRVAPGRGRRGSMRAVTLALVTAGLLALPVLAPPDEPLAPATAEAQGALRRGDPQDCGPDTDPMGGPVPIGAYPPDTPDDRFWEVKGHSGEICRAVYPPCDYSVLPDDLRTYWLKLSGDPADGGGWRSAFMMLSADWPQDPDFDPVMPVADFCETRLYGYTPVLSDIKTTYLYDFTGIIDGDPTCVDTAPGYPDSRSGLIRIRGSDCERSGTAQYSWCEDAALNETGFVVGSSADVCRLLIPAICPAGGQRTGYYTCELVKRRDWTCPAGFVQSNTFPYCYGPPTVVYGTVPDPCKSDGPTFALMTCEEYVGDDWVELADAVACADFAMADHANLWWCEYDTRTLDVDCHRHTPPAGSDCSTPEKALCLKRAEATGGCSRLAASAYCRQLQAEIIDEPDRDERQKLSVKATQEDCQPCVLNPFTAASADCPDFLSVPTVTGSDELNLAHALRHGFNNGSSACKDLYGRTDFTAAEAEACLNVSAPRIKCPDAPVGAPRWNTSHFTGLAIVNSPIVFSVQSDYEKVTHTQKSGGKYRQYDDYLYPRIMWSPSHDSRSLDSRYVWVYNNKRPMLRAKSSPHEDRPTIFHPPVAPADRPADMAEYYWYSGGTPIEDLSVLGETPPSRDWAPCALDLGSTGKDWPLYKVHVEEIWPDNPDDEKVFVGLFGPGALDEFWGGAVTDADKEARTVARGLDYLGHTAVGTPAFAAARADRTRDLSQTVECSQPPDVWCRWMPQRVGYYSVAVGMAWLGWFAERGPMFVDDLRPLICSSSELLSSSPSSAFVSARRSFLDDSNRDLCHAELEALVQDAGVRTEIKELIDERTVASPEELGLELGLPDDWSTLRMMPIPATIEDKRDYLTSAAAFCPPRDLRLACLYDNVRTGPNYSESSAVGIAVGEIRVTTRTVATR